MRTDRRGVVVRKKVLRNKYNVAARRLPFRGSTVCSQPMLHKLTVTSLCLSTQRTILDVPTTVGRDVFLTHIEAPVARHAAVARTQACIHQNGTHGTPGGML